MATQNVSEEQLQSQFTYIDAVARLLGDKRPKAYTHTFGCQQNEADTERIRGHAVRNGLRNDRYARRGRFYPVQHLCCA